MYDCPSTNTRKVNLSAFIVASKSSVVPARTIQPKAIKGPNVAFYTLVDVCIIMLL